jgi:HlyD family secretion protein
LLIPNGAFYNETGRILGVRGDAGRDGGGQAPRRLGRRNADHIEVLEGLEPGEKVLTSPYTGFADKDRLDLQTK